MSCNNDSYDFDSSSDAEMIGYPSSPLSPIQHPVAKSPLVAQPCKTRKSGGSRKGAFRMTNIPLPSHLSAKEIFENHPDRLHNNNLLKVALHYDNSQLYEKLCALGFVKQTLRYRMRSAIKWIEYEFKISSGAFGIAFNREATRNGVYRPVHENPRDDIILARNAAKISEAMAWVKRGGSRIPTTSPSPKSRTVAASVFTNDSKENEAEPTAASIFHKKLDQAQVSKTYPCPHPYCSCTFTTANDNYKHICEVHYQASETLVQRAKARQIAGPLGWVELP
ncbi:hypothetical protein M436DRAFT_86034 [Aureobasidium namibiae CBS 147.97]|uniref:C2H2-type domain-containing protein n=1 Tax=Aureobasidium namibiae CBS 147.97 TaxID=1043004 RepID=A0A074W6W5_9PEZI